MSRQRRRRSMKLQFHDNPNYVTEFEINLYFTRKYSYVIDRCDSTMNVPAALIEVEVETSLLFIALLTGVSFTIRSDTGPASLKSRRAASFATRHCQSPSLGCSMSPRSSFIAPSTLRLRFTHCTSATAAILYYRHECRHAQFRIRLQIIRSVLLSLYGN